MSEAVFYRCERCGNIVALLKSGGGTLNCCGQDMTKLVANSTDASQEKHVPVIKKEGNKFIVEVGSVAHPMAAEHYIEWIALETNGRLEVVHLKPGMKPQAEFVSSEEMQEEIYTGENDEEVLNCEGQPCNFVVNKVPEAKVTAYAYCNLHGLWKAEL